MEKISVYKLSDGTLVENREEAENKQSMITFKKKLDSMTYDMYIDEASNIVNFVTENAETLKAWLNELK